MVSLEFVRKNDPFLVNIQSRYQDGVNYVSVFSKQLYLSQDDQLLVDENKGTDYPIKVENLICSSEI